MLYPPSFKLLNLKSYFSSLIVISFPFINFSLSLSFSTRVIKSAYANPSLSYILYTSLNPGLDIFIISSDNFITGSLSISTILYTPPKQGLDLLTAPGRFLPFGRNALQQRVQHKPRRARARHHKDGVLLPAPQHEQRGGKQQHGNEVHIREPCGQRVRTEK